MDLRTFRCFRLGAIFFLILLSSLIPVAAQPVKKNEAPRPWMNRSLSPDERADMALKQMTLDEKIAQLSQLTAGYNGTWNGLPSFAQSNSVDGTIGNTNRWRYQTLNSAQNTGDPAYRD